MVVLRMNVWVVAISAVVKFTVVKTIVVVTVTVIATVRLIMVAIDVTGLRE